MENSVRLAPSRPTKFAEVGLAALGATVLIWTGGLLFLLQATHLGRFNALYGALGSIVAFLLWLYLSGCAGVRRQLLRGVGGNPGKRNDHPGKRPE